MTQHTPNENPMAKALKEGHYFQAGAIAADEIERLETQLTQLRQDKAELLGAMEEIAKGEGAYNNDPLIHAGNTVDNMKAIANAVIAKAGKEA